MKNEVHFDRNSIADSNNQQTENAKGNADFLSLADEVRARSNKPKNVPLAVAANSRTGRI